MATKKTSGTEAGQKPSSGTREQLVKDVERIRKNFPTAVITRDFYRQHGKFADKAWTEFFPTFKSFVAAGGGQPEAPAMVKETPKAVPVILSPAEQVKIDIAKFAAKNEGQTKKYNELLASKLEAEKNLELALGLKAHEPQITTIQPRQSSGTSSSVAVVVFSDWHVEEPVDPSDVSGVNEFNLEIAKARVRAAWQSALRLYEKESKETKITEVIVALLGDFITNRIHPDLAESNLLEPTDAMYMAQDLIIEGLEFLMKHLPEDVKVTVVCHSGNHGRMTEKQRGKTEAGNSIERFMYFNIRDRFKQESRLKWVIANGYHTIIRLLDDDKQPYYAIRFHHGHAIKSSGGVGGIYPAVNKKIANWNQSVRDVNLDIFGHHHQFVDGQNFICNGSLIGYNDFAIRIGAPYEPPKQAFLLINRKHRAKAMVTPIFLDGDEDKNKGE